MVEDSAHALGLPGTPSPRKKAPFSFFKKHTALGQEGGKEHAGPLPLSWVFLIATLASQKGSKSTFLKDMH